MEDSESGYGKQQPKQSKSIQSGDARVPERTPAGSNGKQHSTSSDETDARIEASQSIDEFASNGTQGLVAQSISYQGPLPHPSDLGVYEQLSPGASTKLIDAHVFEMRSRANALTRLTRAESFGVVFGAIVAGLLIIGGLVSGVTLIILGFPLASAFFGALPVLGGAATGIITASRSGNNK